MFFFFPSHFKFELLVISNLLFIINWSVIKNTTFFYFPLKPCNIQNVFIDLSVWDATGKSDFLFYSFFSYCFGVLFNSLTSISTHQIKKDLF